MSVFDPLRSLGTTVVWAHSAGLGPIPSIGVRIRASRWTGTAQSAERLGLNFVYRFRAPKGSFLPFWTE